MAFEQLPYSNFHDLNLDWIIQQVKEWAAEWDSVKRAFEELDLDFKDVENRLTALEASDVRLSAAVNNLRLTVEQLNNKVIILNSRVTELRNTVSDNYTELDGRVTELEESQVLYMFSPFTGEYEPLPDVITELAQFHLEDALTASEYDALDMTAAYYDAKVLTAYQYDSSGKILLP